MWCVLVEWWDVVRTSGMVGGLKTGSLPKSIAKCSSKMCCKVLSGYGGSC